MMKSNRPIILLLAGGSVIFLAIAVGVFSPLTRQRSTTPENSTAIPIEATSTVLPIPTLPPPLANVEFPTQPIEYPSDWPAELHYPNSFVAVAVSSGTLPEGSTMGWAAKLRYQGSPRSATPELVSFLTTNGWQVSESTELDSGGVLLLIAKGDHGSGIIVVDPDVDIPEYTRILAIVFP